MKEYEQQGLKRSKSLAHKNMFASGIQEICPMILPSKICTVKHFPVQH